MKKLFLVVLAILISVPVFASNENGTTQIIKNGVGFGTVLGVVISWSRNKSILLAILHGVFGWLYVIYYALFLPTKK